MHSEEDLMKAQKEIQYCKSIDHPNVIKCIDWVTMDANFNKNLPEVIMLLPFYQVLLFNHISNIVCTYVLAS